MFGISYGELFLIIGATAALIGPKDLPLIARTVGKLTGKAIGYVQLARGQFDNVMQQSQASMVHKELQDTIAQLEAIRYEIRSISMINPAPFTRRLDGPQSGYTDVLTGSDNAAKSAAEHKPTDPVSKDIKAENTVSSSLYSQAIVYAKITDSPSTKSKDDGRGELSGDGVLTVLPVSADSAGLLPKRTGEVKGSDLMLEAILEAEVAGKAKEFFSQPHNGIHKN